MSTSKEKAIEQQFLRLAQFLFNAPGLTGGGSGSPSNVIEANSAAILAELEAKADPIEDQYSLTRFLDSGVATTVNDATPLPVKISSATGDINITAGDLNVQLDHTGATFDSTRIGDGTDLLGINADGSINVKAVLTQRTPSKTTESSSGSVAAGALSVTLITSSDFVGSVLGDTAKADIAYTFESEETLVAIPYVITSGTIEILKLV